MQVLKSIKSTFCIVLLVLFAILIPSVCAQTRQSAAEKEAADRKAMSDFLDREHRAMDNAAKQADRDRNGGDSRNNNQLSGPRVTTRDIFADPVGPVRGLRPIDKDVREAMRNGVSDNGKVRVTNVQSVERNTMPIENRPDRGGDGLVGPRVTSRDIFAAPVGPVRGLRPVDRDVREAMRNGVSSNGNVRITNVGPVERNTMFVDGRPGAQTIGHDIIIRRERMIYLHNGDRILLPMNELWPNGADVNVERIYDMPLHYMVTIRQYQNHSLSATIDNLVKEKGKDWAIEAGLIVGMPEIRALQLGVHAAVEILRPTPLNEGEGVFWRVPSARGGVVDVWLINERR